MKNTTALTFLAIFLIFAGCDSPRDPEIEALNQRYAVAMRNSDSMFHAHNKQQAVKQVATGVWKDLRNNPDSNIGREIHFPIVEIVYISSSRSELHVKGWIEGDSDLPLWLRSATGSKLRSGEGVPKFYTGDKLAITGKMSGLSEGGLPIIDVFEIINLGV